MKKFAFFLLLLLLQPVHSQNIPRLSVKGEEDLKLSGLKINIDIVGNYAKTTYDMMFYNPNNRTLEGELVFPLAQGQSVSNFAMEVNGAMRQAVVVEKKQARVAYKNTMVRRIDPGLLEKTEGNNYKARIYPIAGTSYKHIIIGFEELLSNFNHQKIYNAALNFKDKLKYFELNIQVVSPEKPYLQPNPFENFKFKKKKNHYTASLALKNYIPNQSFKIIIPDSENLPEVITYNDYFYVYLPLQEKSRLKPKPKHIVVYWDASLSGMQRNTEAELSLLLSYIEYLQNVDVDLYLFSSRIRKDYELHIKNGKTQILKNIINSIVYDGGTSFEALNNTASINYDEILLFSDGLNNLSDWNKLPEKPVYTVNSAVSANHALLQQIADATGGNYLNLNKIDLQTALNKLKTYSLQYLGISEKENIYETYPAAPKSVSGELILAGRFNNPVIFQINLGYAGQTKFTYKIDLSTAEQHPLAKRLWAKQKLAYLETHPKQNKEKIINLATRYHLISDYTSMIILDRIEDYIRYGIEPPEDLKEQYKDLWAAQEKNIRKREEEKNPYFKQLLNEYQEVLDWYYGKKKKEITEYQSQQQENAQTIRNREGHDNRTGTFLLNGTVYENVKPNPEPLPGANIMIKGTNSGVTTDFDGKFSIKVKAGDTLVFMYLGYKTKIYAVGNENNITIFLDESGEVLETVMTTAVDYVKAEEAEAAENLLDSISTEGKTAELGLLGLSGSSGKPIVVRGSRTLKAGQDPLYVLNGKKITSYEELQDIEPEDIAKVFVLKYPLAVNLYGRQGKNGVILIYTKKYYQKHRSEVIRMEQKIKKSQMSKATETPETYMSQIRNAETLDEAYNIYLRLRNDYLNMPVFYIDVSDYFYQKGKPELAIQILTNLAELKLADHELNRALAYKLEAYGKYDMAVKVYQKVLELRPEEPQSYRDLALAYELNGEYQKAFDILYNMFKGKYHRISGNNNFDGIEKIAFIELHHLVSLHADQIKLPEDALQFKKPMPLDIRVVTDWNHNDTDIDLWVFDPDNEKIFYKNPLGKAGGRMSKDFTNGYGPETYSQKKALKGIYNFEVNYYNDRQQKISGPAILKITIFKNYGKPDETRKVILTNLKKKNDHIEVGSLMFQ